MQNKDDNMLYKDAFGFFKKYHQMCKEGDTCVVWQSDNVIASSHSIACNFLLFKMVKNTAQGIFDDFFWCCINKSGKKKKLT